MSCREFVELFLLEWVEGGLPHRRELACAAHLARCAACRQYADSYRATMVAVRALRTAV